MITIIDYGMGNLQSLINAFQFFGEKVKITNNPKEIEGAKKLVFPGVGSFGEAIKNLKRKKLIFAIKKSIQKGTLFLGICLGFQLLFEKSEEAPNVQGLSIFKGKILRFKKVNPVRNRRFLNGVKIPQIGWNQINLVVETPKQNKFATGQGSHYGARIQKKSRIFKGIEDKSFVYFMHSFYVKPIDKNIIVAMTNYGKDFCSAIESENTFGVQFHPEKSGKIGLKILKNFIGLKC